MDEYKLRIDDLVPVAGGGEWFGLLTDSPALGLRPQLTWCFELPFEVVSPDDEVGLLSVLVEWLPIPTESWRHMAGRRLTSTSFAEPAEGSVYHYWHHRFDSVTLTVLEQKERSVHVEVTLAGDIDDLGTDPIRVEGWATFSGILVALHDTNSADAALAELAQYTDVAGLTFEPESPDIALRFVPHSG